MNHRFAVCDTCGALGHTAKSPKCPYRSSQESMERRPRHIERIEVIADPALREATTRTLFLGQVPGPAGPQ
jgi:hypothetical protein